MNYNLSEWALKNKGLVLYLMLLLGIVGVVSYSKLAQSEDPPFTFKVMVVQTYWPGATAQQVAEQDAAVVLVQHRPEPTADTAE